jgi:hypothetical protein
MESALSSEDFAKYPFLKQASKQIEELQFTIAGLSSEKSVFDRAQARVEKAISEVNIGKMDKDKKKPKFPLLPRHLFWLLQPKIRG